MASGRWHTFKDGQGRTDLDDGIVCKRKDSPYKTTEKPSRYRIKVKNGRYSQLEGREELFERAGIHNSGYAVTRQLTPIPNYKRPLVNRD